MNRLLLLYIDAFRYDYLSPENTPFLYSMSQGGFCAPFKPILGYSDSIEATIFTGVYPEEHGYWMMYKYSLETSPFKILKPLGFIDRLPSNLTVRGSKFILSATIGKLLAKTRGYSELSIHNIPLKIIDCFDYTLKRSILSENVIPNFPTIFDVLRDNGVKYSHIDSSKFGLRLLLSSSVKLRSRLVKIFDEMGPDVQMVFIYLHHLDFFAHRLGLKSPKFWQELKHVDGTINLIVDKAKQRFGDGLSIIIFSDHGMTDASNFVDLRELVQDKRFGRDYLLFLDSTMVQVWYLNPDKKEEVRKRFENLGYGYFLSEEEKTKLKLNFNHRYYGDDIYLLKIGYNIFPNFMSLLKPYAMHAYHPDEESQLGIAMFLGRELKITRKKLILPIELAPTILDLLNLEIPASCKAKSLLR